LKRSLSLIVFLFGATAFADSIILESTITTTDTAYADHDQIDTVKTLTGAFEGSSRKGIIRSISVLDKVSQSAALTLHFFDASPTVASSDNATLDIADAQLADKHICKVEIPAASYQALSASTVATVNAIDCLVSSKLTDDLYMVVESAGTPDYTAGTDLVIKIGLER
jgi:hypothetical protein